MKKVLIILLVFLLVECCFGTTWYVSQDGAGSKDGTTYDDRWDTLSSVVWGGDGVVAGDTLYLCGLFLYDKGSGEGIVMGVSGTQADPITIRGDYPGDPAELWQASVFVGAWTDETGTYANVYSKALPNDSWNDYYFEDISLGSHTLLDTQEKITDALTGTWTFTNADTSVTADSDGDAREELDDGDWILSDDYLVWYEVDGEPEDADTITIKVAYAGDTDINPVGETLLMDLSGNLDILATTSGTVFSPAYKADQKLYVHCTDGTAPTGRIAIPNGGVKIRMHETPHKEYITWKNFKWYLQSAWAWGAGDISNITFEGLTLMYNIGHVFAWQYNWDNLTFTNCTIAYGSAGGIYSISANGSVETRSDNLTISGCTIYNIGSRQANPDSDAHGIGIQDGNNHLIENNELFNCGNQLLVYVFRTGISTDGIIRCGSVKSWY